MEVVQAHLKLFNLQANNLQIQIMIKASRIIKILKVECILNLRLKKLFKSLMTLKSMKTLFKSLINFQKLTQVMTLQKIFKRNQMNSLSKLNLI
jgi:hypothetical protein